PSLKPLVVVVVPAQYQINRVAVEEGDQRIAHQGIGRQYGRSGVWWDVKPDDHPGPIVFLELLLQPPVLGAVLVVGTKPIDLEGNEARPADVETVPRVAPRGGEGIEHLPAPPLV